MSENEMCAKMAKYFCILVATAILAGLLGHTITRVTEYKQTYIRVKTVGYCVDKVVGVWKP